MSHLRGEEASGLKTRHILMAFSFILLTIFLFIIIFSRSSEERATAQDGLVPDAGYYLPATTPASSSGQPIDVNPAPTQKPISDEKPDVDISSWQFILANSEHNIGKYAPTVTAVEDTAQFFDERAVDALVEFLNAARAAGYTPYIMTAYRPYSTQEYYYNGKASQISWPDYPSAEDYEAAAKLVAQPGTSDHQTGLGVDITDKYYSSLDASLMDQDFLAWMAENCADYGFILRYPSLRKTITGWDEPWHFRYVGKEAAEYIMTNNLCLEQFIEMYD